MNEENAGSDPSRREPEGEANDDVTRTYVEVVDPEEGVSPGSGLIQIWARCWEDNANIGVAFYVTYELGTRSVSTLQYALDTGFGALRRFDPHLQPKEFLRRLRNRSVQDQEVPSRLSQDVGEILEGHVTGNFDHEAVDGELRRGEEETLREWLERLLGELLGTDAFRYQVRARRIRTEPHLQDPGDGGDGGARRPWEEAEVVPVSFLTSPSRGREPDEIESGDRVIHRLDATEADWLPGSMLDEEKEGVSVPISSSVVTTLRNPDLPADFDGEPGNYREVIVQLRDEIFGRGFVYEKEKIKVESSRDEGAERTTASDYLSIAVMVALVIIVMLILVFLV